MEHHLLLLLLLLGLRDAPVRVRAHGRGRSVGAGAVGLVVRGWSIGGAAVATAGRLAVGLPLRWSVAVAGVGGVSALLRYGDLLMVDVAGGGHVLAVLAAGILLGVLTVGVHDAHTASAASTVRLLVRVLVWDWRVTLARVRLTVLPWRRSSHIMLLLLLLLLLLLMLKGN